MVGGEIRRQVRQVHGLGVVLGRRGKPGQSCPRLQWALEGNTEQNDSYPAYWRDTNKGNWVEEVLGSRRNAGGGYGELGDIWRYKLDELSGKRGDAEAERKELKAAYKYLTQAIRNRDAHSYVADQRRKDLFAVEPIFVPAFNTLVQAMKDKGHFKATGP